MEEQETAHEHLAKRMKLDRVLMFKKNVHEKQYYFNETVKYKMKEAHRALSESMPALKKAKPILHEGERLIESTRNKLGDSR